MVGMSRRLALPLHALFYPTKLPYRPIDLSLRMIILKALQQCFDGGYRIMYIEWRDDLLTGVDEIDWQHKELFVRFNLLLDACQKG